MVLSNSKRKEGKLFSDYFILIGVVCLAFAAIIAFKTFSPVINAEVNYQQNINKTKDSNIAPVDPNFSIIIPKINANSKVVKNVDPFNSKIYQHALTQGVAHAKGSALPGASGNTFIFAHSAGNWYEANQYNAVFYLLNKLSKGDEIIVYYQSNKYTYKVKDTKLINGSETSYLLNNSSDKQLTLMTCWPPGTTLKRLLVIADLML